MTLVTDLDTMRSAAPGSQDARWRRLFNRASFHGLNRIAEQNVLFTEVRDSAGRILGGFSGVRDGDTFVSGYGAPFGGADIVNDHESADNIAHIVLDSVRQLEASGVRAIRLKLPPMCYSANEAVVQFTLMNAGFVLDRCELNQHLAVHRWRTALEYVHHLSAESQRELQVLIADHLSFNEVTDGPGFECALALLNQRSEDPVLATEYVARARVALSPHVRMFTLTDRDDEPIAAALVYRVGPGRDLVIAWDEAGSPVRSKMILLAYRLVERCINEGIGLLDLGLIGNLGSAGGSHVRARDSEVLASIEPQFTLLRRVPGRG